MKILDVRIQDSTDTFTSECVGIDKSFLFQFVSELGDKLSVRVYKIINPHLSSKTKVLLENINGEFKDRFPINNGEQINKMFFGIGRHYVCTEKAFLDVLKIRI